MSARPKHLRHHYGNDCYAAEHRAGALVGGGRGNPTLMPNEARQVVAYVTADHSWAAGPVTVTLSGSSTTRRGAGRGFARYSANTVNFNRTGITAALVIHELAHLADAADRGTSDHGPIFRAVYLDLAERWMPYYGRRLRAAFRYYRLDPA